MKLQRPNLPVYLPEPEDDICLRLRSASAEEEEIEGLYIRDCFLAGEDMTGLRCCGAVFENCRLSGAVLRRASFVDVKFINCDFSNCHLEEGYMNRCEFLSCKWVGASLESGTLRQTALEGCQLQYCNLDHSLFDFVRVRKSDFSDAYLTECRLKKAEFEACRFFHASFYRTLLKGIDLTDCELGALVLSEDHHELKGAVVSADQALELSRLLGIVIR